MKAFIFDMDGVIVNSEPVHYKLITKTYAKYGKEFTHEEHKKITGMSYMEIWKKFVNEHNILADSMAIHKEHTEALLNEILHSGTFEISKGIVEFIEDLYKNGVKLAVASSSSRTLINAVLERFKLKDKFQAVVSGEELPKSKPHPGVFLKALEELGVKAEEALIVEDSTNGIKAAKAARVKCLAFLNRGENEQDISLADHSFDCFTELSYEKVRKYL